MQFAKRIGRTLRQLAVGQRGDVMETLQPAIMLVIVGVIVLVVGLVMAPTVIDQAQTAGSNASIGSFSGAQSFNDLIPLFYYIILVGLSLGLIGVGVRLIRAGANK